MPLAAVALFAGTLSVLAPCVVGLLPILIGRSVAPGSRSHSAILVIAGDVLLLAGLLTIVPDIELIRNAVPGFGD